MSLGISHSTTAVQGAPFPNSPHKLALTRYKLAFRRFRLAQIRAFGEEVIALSKAVTRCQTGERRSPSEIEFAQFGASTCFDANKAIAKPH